MKLSFPMNQNVYFVFIQYNGKLQSVGNLYNMYILISFLIQMEIFDIVSLISFSGYFRSIKLLIYFYMLDIAGSLLGHVRVTIIIHVLSQRIARNECHHTQKKVGFVRLVQ